MHERDFLLICRVFSVSFAVFAPLLLMACSAAPTRDDFKGTALTNEMQAADFELTDQFGEMRSLREDFSGKVVVLTFLYTRCPDVCPIVANHLRDISSLLEEDSSDTAIVVVSVDPVGDTVDSAFTYSERWQMGDAWTYLVGSEEALSPVWKAYYIDPYVHGPGSADSVKEAGTTPKSPGGGVSALVELSGRVIHSAPIYVIDAKDVMRSAFTLPLEPQDVVHDVKLVGG